MTPYRGPRFNQVGPSQWEWEEEKAAERREEIEGIKLTHRRDYCWHRSGWLWEVRVSWLNDAGEAVHTEPALRCRFWSETIAAAVSNAIFGAYEDGRSIQRKVSDSSGVRQMNEGT